MTFCNWAMVLIIILFVSVTSIMSHNTTCNFQQSGILTSVDSDEPVHLLLSLETVRSVALQS